MEPSLEGWNINKIGDVDWVPWGSSGNAQGKILGTADGFYVVVVRAEAGYRGDPHMH